MLFSLLIDSLAAASAHALLATAGLGGVGVLLALWHDDVRLPRLPRPLRLPDSGAQRR